MIASLAMEHFAVLLPHLASLSMMKACASSGTVLVLLKHQFTALARSTGAARTGSLILVFMLALVLAIVFVVTQVFSILLISDTAVRVVHGLSATTNLTVGSTIAGDITSSLVEDNTWLRAPARYPTFAEYSEPPYVADGVLDTGVTLRAFLPFPGAGDRQLIQTYSGSATVLDARVTCQRPKFSNLSVEASRPGYLDVKGIASPTVTTPRMISPDIYLADSGRSFDTFNGTVPLHAEAPMQSQNDDLWGISITTIGSSLLVSEFSELTGLNTYPSRLTYLVFNVSRGSMNDWSFNIPYNDTAARLNPTLTNRSEWLDIRFANNSLVLSASLCYTPWDQANLPVQISSQHNANRTESAPSFDLDTMCYTYAFLRKMYGQKRNSTADQRGVLSMQKTTWRHIDTRTLRNVSGRSTSASLGGASNLGADSAMLGGTFSKADLTQTQTQLAPFDGMFFPLDSYNSLAQETLQTTGGIAFMLQSLITLMSSMTYYDLLDAYDLQSPVQVAHFVQATVPVSGTGLCTVTTALGVHFVLMVVVLVLFLRSTEHSRLGATWAAMAQMQGGVVGDEGVEGAAWEGDEEVEARMKSVGIGGRRVGINVVGGRVEVALKED